MKMGINTTDTTYKVHNFFTLVV